MANEHYQCLHEGDIAVMKDNIEKMDKKVDKVLDILQNGDGLVTQVALLKQEVKSSKKRYLLFGGAGGASTGGLAWLCQWVVSLFQGG